MRTTRIEGIDKDWSVITLGCWQIAPSGGWGDLCSPQDADATVKASLEAGITAFDTAEGYGDGESERRLSNALGNKKDDVIIISKIWPDAELTIDGYKERLDGTLKALNRDYVDLYLVHWPGPYFNTKEKTKALCELMFKLKDSGKAKTIGLSNFQSGDLSLMDNDASSFCVNQIPYSLLEREYEGESLEACKKANIGYMAYSPTARGLLAGKFAKEDMGPSCRKNYEVYQEPLFTQSKKVYSEVSSIAEEIGAAPINVALAWVLAQDNLFTAIAGSRKPHQVPEFAKAGDLMLSDDILSRLNDLSDNFHQVKAGE
jgi:aryl-alcohol dehydrogenase-like predicted oxidoreductase